MNQKNLIENSSSKFIEIKGKDSAFFLQGLITNDIYKCNNETLIYSCFLSPQGKFLADFFISIFNDYYLIEIHEKYFENFYNKLKIYKLRSDVKFKENSDLKSLIILTKDKPEFDEKIYIFNDPRSANLGYKVYVNKTSKILNKINKLNYKFYKELLIKNLIPNTTEDLTENKSVLLENNFQNINAIDWDKGCYIGQEITARMKYRALLKKQIYVLELLLGEINPGDNIVQQDINIGKVISKVSKYVLCMLKIDFVENKNLKKEEIKINSNVVLKFL